MHAFNFSPGEAEAGRFVGSRPGLSTKRVPGELRLHRETLSQKRKTERGEEKEREKEGEKGKKGREEEREIKDKGTKRKFSVHLP